MKHPTEKPSERVMRFFTPELYLQFNSPDDEQADRANEAWETAVQDYRRHLDGIRPKMLSQVRKVADLCLHDAEVLGFDQEWQSFGTAPEPFWPGPQPGRSRNGTSTGCTTNWARRRISGAGFCIAFSDGSAMEIPFVSVVTSSVRQPDAGEGSATRRSA